MMPAMNASPAPGSDERIPAPRVWVSLINWNDHDDTARALASLRTLEFRAFRTLVIDNGSTDDSLRRLRAQFPEADYLPLPENLGFGAANNHALRRALADGTPYVWLLNNDAEADPDALTAMVRALDEEPRLGAAGCVIRDMQPPHAVQAWGGGRIVPWLAIVRRNRTARTPPQYLTGASLLLRTSAVREVGLFDEAFFLYWEDTDICYRLRKGGWGLAVAPVVVRHKGSSTTGRDPRLRSFHTARSFVLFLSRHHRLPRLKSAVAIAFQSALKLLRGRFSAAWGFWEGWLGGLAALGKPRGGAAAPGGS